MGDILPTIDQHQAIRHLSNRFRHRNIPHALIFIGIDGIGRKILALRFAMAVNCMVPSEETSFPDSGRNQPKGDYDILSACGNCLSCKKIRSDQHPDILQIKPIGETIKIDQIRGLIRQLALKPYEAKHRVVIIESSPAMTLPSANALLKVLEEPPERTTIILMANKTADLIATIVSRCQTIRFTPISDRRMMETLLRDYQVTDEMAEAVTYLAQGSMTKLETLLTRRGEKQIQWIMEELKNQIQISMSSATNSPRRAMVLSALLASDPLLKERFFAVMKLWLRDLAVWPQAPGEVRLQADREGFGKLKTTVTPEKAIALFSAVEKMEYEIAANANSRLAMETFFIGTGDDL